MIGLAFEIHDTKYPLRKGEVDETLLKLYQNINPSVLDIFSYAYCYMGLLAGKCQLLELLKKEQINK